MSYVAYHPKYDIRFFGLERFHPFDSRKYSRAWKVLQKYFGKELTQHTLRPERPINRDELLTIHSEEYLEQLRSPAYIAGALELPFVRFLPAKIIDSCVLNAMRWGTMGTVLAAKEALSSGFMVNLSGGYHHAKPECGEGFCIYSDIAIAVALLRQQKLIEPTDTIAYIDLDAHQGNGVCYAFLTDRQVSLFDMYNSHIYPVTDYMANQRIDWNIPLEYKCQDQKYLNLLIAKFPDYLSLLQEKSKIKLAIYNAGTDVFEKDPLGALGLSAEGILKRDLFVIDALQERNIPTLMLLSGGYTPQSYQLVADTVKAVLEKLLAKKT